MSITINGSGSITGVSSVESISASDVDFTPSGNISATTVQAALADIAGNSGAANIGYDGGTVQDVLDGAKSLVDYAALRSYTGSADRIYITGALGSAKPAGIAGAFHYDATDTTSIEDFGTIIVGSDGRRWKRDFDGAVFANWFGAMGDNLADDTQAILRCLKTEYPVIQFMSGIYLCDPISFGTTGNPTLATKKLIGASAGYLGTLSTSEKNLVTIRCRTAAPIFWEVTLAHRFQMEGITLDANALCDTTYKLTSYCTMHDYFACSFVNAKNGGDNVVIGDAVNLQAEMVKFRVCFFTNTLGLTHSRNVYITGSNQISNAFEYCRFINSDYHIWFANGCQNTSVEWCDFYAYTNNAIVAVGSSTYSIKNNYTESSTGTAFFAESSVAYVSGSQGLCLLENNYINTALGNVTISPNHQVVVRGNRIGGTLTVSAPTAANAYYPPEIHNNQYAAIMDSSNVSRRWNNMDGGVGQDSDAGELIAVSVGQGTTSADTYRKYKRPIQINTGAVYSSSSGNFNIANNCNAGGDNAALVAGYGQSLSFGGASGNISLLASTTSAAGTGSIHTLVGALVDGSNSALRPSGDNTISLGRASFRWSVVYAGTGTINTSDEREKQDIDVLSASELRVASVLKGLIRKYRFKDAVQAKGDSARIHFGVIAQDVMAAFETEGLDPMLYGIICYDEWYEVPEQKDDNGTVVQEASGATYSRYGVRYEELLAFIIAAL